MFDHSFIIPAYKDSPYIRTCISSLKEQSLSSPIYVTTSTPTDSLRDTCNEFGVELVVHDQGGSIANDWNFALSYAQSQFVTLAHQDDIYYPNYTESILELVVDSQDVLIAFSDYNELVGTNTRSSNLNLIVKKLLLTGAFLSRSHITSLLRKRLLLSFGCPIPCPGVTFNKTLIGNFKFAQEYSVNLDWDAWDQLSHKRGSFSYVRKILFGHRIYSESQTSLALISNVRILEDRSMFSRYWPAPIAFTLAKLYSFGYLSNKR